MTAEQEGGLVLDRGTEVLAALTGQVPVGFRAPMWELNWHSPELLAERGGFLYDTSLMDADHPYELRVGATGSSLVEIPVQWALDDWEQYCYLPEISGSGLIESPPRKAAEIWRLEFEGLRAVGGCFVLTNHPFLSGRPSRAAALEELVEHVVSCSDVWVAPCGTSRFTYVVWACHLARSNGLIPRTSDGCRGTRSGVGVVGRFEEPPQFQLHRTPVRAAHLGTVR